MTDRTPLPDSFALHPEAAAIGAGIIRAYDELGHLSEARLAYVASQPTPMLHGWPCWAFVAQPRVQGPMREWFEWALAGFCAPQCEGEVPDFVVIVDAALWPSWDGERQERVIYHELSHIIVREDPETGVPKLGEDGRPLLRLKPHDYEFFDAEVRRYGPEVCELDRAAAAIADGYRAAERRRRRRA